MKYLCVAEKNDAAKTISGFLSRGRAQRVRKTLLFL
jgi:DNA topoisomerase IA